MHIWLIELTLAVVQALETQKDVTVDSVIRTVDSHIVGEWKQRGVCPWQAGDQSSDLSWQTFEIGQDGSNRWRSRQTISRMHMKPDSKVAYIQYWTQCMRCENSRFTSSISLTSTTHGTSWQQDVTLDKESNMSTLWRREQNSNGISN